MFRAKVILFIFVLVIVTLLVYSNAISGEFLFDDEHFIVRNPYIKDFKYLPDLFAGNVLSGIGFKDNFYRPLSFVAYLFVYKIFGLDPVYFHLISIIFHILCGIVLFNILQYITNDYYISLIGSAFFLLHPVQTESVSYVSGCAAPMSLLLLLLVLYANIKLYKTNNIIYIILIFVVTVLSILAKERAVMIFVVLPLFDITFLKKKIHFKKFVLDKKRLTVWSGLLVIVMIYVVLRLTILNFGGTLNFYKEANVYSENLLVRLYTFSYAFLLYLKFIVFPYPLYMERTIPVFTDWNFIQVEAGILIFVFFIFAAVNSYFNKKIIFFGFLWFIIFLMPTSGIIPINAIIMEHWLYFSMIGVSIALALIIIEINNKYFSLKKIQQSNLRKKVKYFFGGIIVICLLGAGVLTFLQNRIWKNSHVFFSHILKYNDWSVKAHNNLAMALSDKGEIKEAIYHYKQSVMLDNSFPQPHHNLARLYIKSGNTLKALEEYNQALKINPDFVFTHLDLGSIYTKLGKMELADYHQGRAKEILGK